MSSLNQPIATLHTLLLFEAGQCSSGEMQLRAALPDWILKARSPKLREVLKRYQGQVESHISELGAFIESQGMLAGETRNGMVAVFTQYTDEKLASCADHEVCDAALLAAIQAINHYKISLYGTAAAWARTIGMEPAEHLFRKAEMNEKQTDDRLSQLAEFEINEKAKAPLSMDA